MSILSDIASYVQGLDLSKEDPLKFLVEDNIRTNPFHKYIVRKIVSQLKVEDHIHGLGPALKTGNVRDILRPNSRKFGPNINEKHNRQKRFKIKFN